MALRAGLLFVSAIIVTSGCGGGGGSPDGSAADAPADLSSGDVPADLSSGDIPPDLSSGDVPVDLSSGDVPVDLSSGDVPVDLSSGDVPVDAPGNDGGVDAGSDVPGTDGAADAASDGDSDGGTGVDGGTAGGPCGVLGWGLDTIAAIAPGGASFALATSDGHLEVRRWSDNTALGIDNGFFGAAAVGYSPNGALFAAATSDAVKVWRVSDGAQLASIAELAKANRVAVSNDGSVVAAVRSTQVLVSRAAGIATIGLSGPAAVGVSPDGTIVATIDIKKFSTLVSSVTAAAWRSSDGQPAWSADMGTDTTGTDFSIASAHVTFSRDGTMVAFGRGAPNGGTSGLVLHTADGSRVTSTGTHLMAFSDDGQALVGFASDGSYAITRVSDGGTARFFTLPTGAKVMALGFGAGTTTLAVVQPSSRDELQLMTDAVQVATIPRVSWQWPLDSVVLAPDGSQVVGGGRVWDTRSSAVVGTWSGGVAFSPDSARLASFNSNSVTVGVVKAGSSAPTFTIPMGAQSVVFAPDNTLIATGHLDGTANLWNASTGALVRQLWNLTVNASEITGIAFSPDSTRVATASGGTLKVWRAADGADLTTINAGARVDTVRFSADGAWLIGAMEAGSPAVRIWDIATGTVVQSLSGSSNAVSPSAGGVMFIATSTGIERFRLPDFADLGPVPSSEKGGIIRSIDITADGTMIASTGASAVVRLWCLH
jgi:WD40 repeat protein